MEQISIKQSHLSLAPWNGMGCFRAKPNESFEIIASKKKIISLDKVA